MANIYYIQFTETWKVIAILGGGRHWVWTRGGDKEEGEVRERTLSTSSISSMELSQERKRSWFMRADANDSLQAELCKRFLACLTGFKKKKKDNKIQSKLNSCHLYLNRQPIDSIFPQVSVECVTSGMLLLQLLLLHMKLLTNISLNCFQCHSIIFHLR